MTYGKPVLLDSNQRREKKKTVSVIMFLTMRVVDKCLDFPP